MATAESPERTRGAVGGPEPSQLEVSGCLGLPGAPAAADTEGEAPGRSLLPLAALSPKTQLQRSIIRGPCLSFSFLPEAAPKAQAPPTAASFCRGRGASSRAPCHSQGQHTPPVFSGCFSSLGGWGPGLGRGLETGSRGSQPTCRRAVERRGQGPALWRGAGSPFPLLSAHRHLGKPARHFSFLEDGSSALKSFHFCLTQCFPSLNLGAEHRHVHTVGKGWRPAQPVCSSPFSK